MTPRAFTSSSVERLVLSRQHLTDDSHGENEGDVVRIISDVSGLHAQSYESPYLALWSRMTDLDWKWLDNLLRQKMLVAAHLMRVTLHIVPTKEFPIYFQATREAQHKFHRSRGLTWPPKLTLIHQAILDFVNEKNTATTLEIRRFLESKGLPTDNLHRIIHYDLAGTGAIIRSERSPEAPSRWRWAITEELIDKSSLEGVAEDEAKEWLVQKYLKAFGPSSVEDIVSYTWHTKTETRKIIEELVAKGKVSEMKANKTDKQWVFSEDLEKLKQSEGKNYVRERRCSAFVLPEFDPLIVGYRKRWKGLISVPPTRPGLRPHPAPGVILVDGKIYGTYLNWPHFALFLNAEVTDEENAETLKTVLNRFEEMAMLKGMEAFCVKRINEKDVVSKELHPILDYFYELGYIMRKGYLCKQLL